MAERTNDEWAAIIATKVSQVLADTYKPEFQFASSITAPSSDAFPATIDHTLLKPDATPAQIDELCSQAIQYNFKSCCVNGANVKQVAQRLEGSKSIACAVIGFPLGAGTSSSKAFETSEAIKDGAKEIDMVINIGALKSKNYALLYSDIALVASACQDSVPLKVILETFFLSDEEKIAASFIAAEAGATFVKTCTGFLGGGATAEDVLLMKKTVAYNDDMKVKASAGIRSFEKCVEMYKAGADRIGTSSGVAIVQNASVAPGTY